VTAPLPISAPSLVSERPEHRGGVEAVLDSAFGPGRFAKSSERVRERGATFEGELSRVALSASGQVIGCCRIWRVRAGDAAFHFLGPLAVRPDAQHAGLGVSLVEACVAACRIVDSPGIVLVGAPAFFKPLGFTRVPEGRLIMPAPTDPKRLLWRALSPGGFDAAKGEIVGA